MTQVSASAPALSNNTRDASFMKGVEKAAKEFEAVFLSEMFSHMHSGLDTDPMFGGGRGEKIFRSMLVNEYAKNLAHGPGVGIAAHIQRAMIDMQQKANGAAQ